MGASCPPAKIDGKEEYPDLRAEDSDMYWSQLQ